MSQRPKNAAQQPTKLLEDALAVLKTVHSREKSYLVLPSPSHTSSVYRKVQTKGNKKPKSVISRLSYLATGSTTTSRARNKEHETKVTDAEAGKQAPQHTTANMEHILTESGAWTSESGDNKPLKIEV